MALVSVCTEAILQGASLLALLTLFITGNILKLLPYKQYFIPKLFKLASGVELPLEMYLSSFAGFEMMKALWRMCHLNIKAKLKEGESFPDAQLVDTANLQRVNVSDLVQHGRPLVLNFGSSS
ncbi:type I iodothyronine deiodinase-like [Paramuricea clavata]|uniref:Type I iodothyronine deiodinase-like n=1 Tax=Paramuricea clavata TaxID=317549 RepID=A0A6S7GP25_PARCT|nr:type I iodothyronine deiodinase-like [Paramuricea clavata]